MNWTEIMKVFGFNREIGPEVQQAREIANRISERADELQEHLQVYQRAKDPFAAMMADLYNRDQLSRIHRGTTNGHN